MSSYHARRLACAALIVLLAAGGCSSRGPEYGEVEGVVTLNSKPLPDVEVEFFPDASKGMQGPRASAYTDEQGRFQLHSEQTKRSGAVVGKHLVCLHDLTSVPPPPEPDAQTGIGPARTNGYRPGPPRVPQVYTGAGTTPFRDVEVHSGSQKLDFELQSNRR